MNSPPAAEAEAEAEARLQPRAPVEEAVEEAPVEDVPAGRGRAARREESPDGRGVEAGGR